MGGSDNLNKCVREGRVVRSEHKAVELFFFPRVRMGKRTTNAENEKLDKGKHIKNGDFDSVADKLLDLNLEITCSRTQWEVALCQQSSKLLNY